MSQYSKPKVIGVAHSSADKDYQRVLNYIKNNVKEVNDVALELCPYDAVDFALQSNPDLEQLVQNENAKNTTNQFWNSVISEALKKAGCAVLGVDDEQLINRATEMHNNLSSQLENGASGYLTHIISGEFIPFWREFFEIHFLRSIHMYKKAAEYYSDFLIVGASHAYDIYKLGLSSNIVYLTNLPITLKIISAINCRRFKKGKFSKSKYIQSSN